MRKLNVIAVFAITMLFLFTAACGTLNNGSSYAPGFQTPRINSITVEADAWEVGRTATITIDWTGSLAPFSYSIETGSEAGTITGTTAEVAPIVESFTLSEEGWHYGYVTIRNSVGYANWNSPYGGDSEFHYGPVDPAPVPLLIIDNISVSNGVLTVTISDPEGEDLIVSVTDIAGLTVDTNSRTVTGGNGDAVFTFTADDAFTGGTGTTTVTCQSAENTARSTTEDVTVTVEPIVLGLFTEGTLGAIPLTTTCAVGDVVTILVVAADFPAAAAFNYMNGVAVTVTDGGDYVAGTFNVGSIGGGQKDIDGIWADMQPAPSTFFIPEDFMMAAIDVTADPSLDFMGFNITPIGAGEVSGGGNLFNFGIAFDAPGEYELGFLEFQDVKRTYYSDNAGVEYNWTDIANQFNSVTTIVTVN